MAEDIITSDYDSEEIYSQDQNSTYLSRENILSEFSTAQEKATARNNLEVYSKSEVNSRITDQVNGEVSEAQLILEQLLDDALASKLNSDDLDTILLNFVRRDGKHAFTDPVSGKPATKSSHLTTLSQLNQVKQGLQSDIDLLKTFSQQTQDSLKNYALKENVYNKHEVYNKKEIDSNNSQYIKKDGSVSFTKPISGITPQISSHLSTKKYVDDLITSHKTELDPHGYTEILTNRLKKYALAANVLDKTQTYTRAQVDYLVDRLVNDAVSTAMDGYLSLEDPYNILDKVKLLGYVNRDGSVPFDNPQHGVDAIEDDQLTTLKQLKEYSEQLQQAIDDKKVNWITSGPVLSKVGLVEQGTEFAKEVSIQEIFDAIFYGRGINIIAPEYGFIGESVPVTICVRGDLAEFEHGELYQNGKLIVTLTKEDFENSSCITIDSEPITEDTEFIFKAFYLNGSEHEVNAMTKLSLPVFAGILPKWKPGQNVSFSYLEELCGEDSTNNKFYALGQDLTKVEHKYNFKNIELKQPILAVPYNYPSLYQMCTPSQQFGIDAFNIVDVPMKVPGANEDIVYKLYIYKEALVQLNIPVNFTF